MMPFELPLQIAGFPGAEDAERIQHPGVGDARRAVIGDELQVELGVPADRELLYPPVDPAASCQSFILVKACPPIFS